MSKRVSNKKGGGGARSRRGYLRFLAKRKPVSTAAPIVPQAVARKIAPPKSSGFLQRIVRPVRRFFRGG